jgi:hypothetical protein
VSCDRPDYLFLTEALEEEARDDMTPEQLSLELKRLATTWVKRTNRDWVIGENIVNAVEKWDPLTEGYFNEMVVDHLQGIVIEQQRAAIASRPLEYRPPALEPTGPGRDPYAVRTAPLTELNIEAFGNEPHAQPKGKKLTPAELLRSQPTLFPDEGPRAPSIE